MQSQVAVAAQRDQVLLGIIPGLTAKFQALLKIDSKLVPAQVGPIKLVGSRKFRVDSWSLGIVAKHYELQGKEQKSGDEGRAQEREHETRHSG